MSAMPFEDLEAAYEMLAMAIDSAGAQRETLFLTRLVLLLRRHYRLPECRRGGARGS